MTLTPARREEVRRGIAAYEQQQQVFLRYLRRYGEFTAAQFDRWFNKPSRSMRIHAGGIDGDSFLLGIGINGFTSWAENLELLQYMLVLDLVDAVTRDGDGMVVYRHKPQ